jgi:hypothetical protein
LDAILGMKATGKLIDIEFVSGDTPVAVMMLNKVIKYHTFSSLQVSAMIVVRTLRMKTTKA